jgi:hypothetical protein
MKVHYAASDTPSRRQVKNVVARHLKARRIDETHALSESQSSPIQRAGAVLSAVRHGGECPGADETL